MMFLRCEQEPKLFSIAVEDHLRILEQIFDAFAARL